jgi:hypothetical protein
MGMELKMFFGKLGLTAVLAYSLAVPAVATETYKLDPLHTAKSGSKLKPKPTLQVRQPLSDAGEYRNCHRNRVAQAGFNEHLGVECVRVSANGAETQ